MLGIGRGLEQATSKQLGRLVPLVDEREDREQPLACERVGVLQPTHEGAHKGRVAELGHDATWLGLGIGLGFRVRVS